MLLSSYRETNLKVRQSLPETAEINDDIRRLAAFDAEFVCEAPNNRLAKFEGMMKWNNKTYAIDNDKMILRGTLLIQVSHCWFEKRPGTNGHSYNLNLCRFPGCVLRNTKWCFGLVIFAGQESKLMMNSGKAKFKRTHIDRLVNILIIGVSLPFIYAFIPFWSKRQRYTKMMGARPLFSFCHSV